MSQLLHVEIPNSGPRCWGSLNEQRILGTLLRCIHPGQRPSSPPGGAVAASSLYFRDLFRSVKSQFELPSSVTPAASSRSSPSATRRITMAAQRAAGGHVTAGYLQIQHIVERGMDLLFKANSPNATPRPQGPWKETGSESPEPQTTTPPPHHLHHPTTKAATNNNNGSNASSC
ncbi:unnamed protein product [Arctogadus glacialis]